MTTDSDSNGRENYQVALSFAGEQRDYVEEVARHLQSRSIALFYDGFEKVDLWGQSAVEAFHGSSISSSGPPKRRGCASPGR